MRPNTPVVVLVLGGAAERWDCDPARSPLALADSPNLDRLAQSGRVLGVRLVEQEQQVSTVAPLLSTLGINPELSETAPSSYLGLAAGQTIADEECFCCADFVSLFRNTVADVEPGPLRAAESDALFRVARDEIKRAGFRLIKLGQSHHLAIGPRASLDANATPTFRLQGLPYSEHEPQSEQHAFAHRLARESLDGHEINEVRRDLGGNGWDALWLWGPGGRASVERPFADEVISAHGSHPLWRSVCTAAGIPLGQTAGSPASLLREVDKSLHRKKAGVIWIYLRRGERDAYLRELSLRGFGISEVDRLIVGPLADVAAKRGARLLVLPDAAWDTKTGTPSADPVPALIWGKGVEALRTLPFHEQGAGMAGEPIAPGYGLIEYVRSL
jgi:2,3-bisphosphoglycerate-independent phosphoglycerate mutase